MAHWSAQFVGQPYVLGDADCAALAVQVRREVFKRPVPPAVEMERAASALGRARQMADGVLDYGVRTEYPQEGDVVLMRCRGRPSHVGVFCLVDDEPSVLHAMKNAGMAVLHRLRDLPRVNLAVEGFYQWK